MCFFHVAKGRLYFYASLFCALFCIWHIKEISKNLPLATALKGGFNMSRIMVNNLTFYYEGSPDYIFDHVSFSIDTNWKLGFIGRNGKGKTTFLNLLLGAYEYQGTIDTTTLFDYFPYTILPEYMESCTIDFMDQLKRNCELWRVLCELDSLQLDANVLYRPFYTLSHGERTKVMLAILFSGENDFLLIDEPTNHLDKESREIVKQYLLHKKGFILVSHDRDLLDACIDHVLVLNRCSIEIQNGNFSSWWENKSRKDLFSQSENEKHKKEIQKLKKASARARQWADNNEQTKIGSDPIKDHDRGNGTRPYIGAKTKKMQSRVKQMENRIAREIEEKEGLLQDIEAPAPLKIMPLTHYKNTLISIKDYSLQYPNTEKPIFQNLSFELEQKDRLFLKGQNGCGKSSLIKSILSKAGFQAQPTNIIEQGTIQIASGLTISYISQDTSFLTGTIQNYCKENNLDESLFCALLRQLDLERIQFIKPIESFSEGQKKKVLLATSLMTPAHLYIWDEPLNYIDIFSRVQIENLLQQFPATMLLVEHDIRFQEKIATKVIEFSD